MARDYKQEAARLGYVQRSGTSDQVAEWMDRPYGNAIGYDYRTGKRYPTMSPQRPGGYEDRGGESGYGKAWLTQGPGGYSNMGRPRPQPKTLQGAMLGAGGMGGWNRGPNMRGPGSLRPGMGGATMSPYSGQNRGPNTRRPVGPTYTGGDYPGATGGTNYPSNVFGKATGSNKWADLYQSKLGDWGENSLAEQFYGSLSQDDLKKLLENPSPNRKLQEMLFQQMQSKFEDPYNQMYAPYEQKFMGIMNDRLSGMAPGGGGNPTLAGTVEDVNAIFPQYQGLGDIPTSDFTAADYYGGKFTGADFVDAPWKELGRLQDLPDYQQRLQDELGMSRDATAGAYGSQRQQAMQRAAGYAGSEGLMNQTLADIDRQEAAGRIGAEREARGGLRGLLERETGAERGFRERQAMAKTGFGQEEAARRTGYDVGEAARRTGFSQDEAGRKTAFGQWGADRGADWEAMKDERGWGAKMAGWGAAERETAARRALAQGDLAAALQIAGMGRNLGSQGYGALQDMYNDVAGWQREKKRMKEQKKQGMWELGGALTGTVVAGLMGQPFGGMGGGGGGGGGAPYVPGQYKIPGTEYYF